MSKIELYAFRQYNHRGKKKEEWRLRVGMFSTGPGKLVSTKELEEYEKELNIKRFNRKK